MTNERDFCVHHEDAVKIIKELEEWKTKDEVYLQQSQELLKEIRNDMKELKNCLVELKLDVNTKYSTWAAHDKLQDEMRVMNEELRKYVIRTFRLGITIAGAVFGFVQWILSFGGY